MPISFSSLGVREDLVNCLDRLGITEPYAIQAATLPDVLAGRDVVAQSPTGSGKTLAFALPLVSHIGRAEPRRPRGLVLAPTRELAAQIADTIEPLANVVGRRVTCVYGGVGYRPQLKELYRGVDIVVGCPGRLGDLRERGAIDLSAVEVLVIDEADRMADMGFLPEVERLVKTIEGRHQTMLFSATLAGSVERLVSTYQHNPVRHVLALPVHDVGTRSHEFRRTARENRNDVTSELVATVGSSIVFCRTKHGVDRLAKHLTRQGLAVAAIHGDRSQAQRDHALAQFRNGHARALVGTDVASRGLHVDGVDCVIHFDAPEDEDTYVHRSGRTGRAGASGRVISLVMPQNERDALRLEQRFGAASHQPSAEPAAPAAVGGRQMSRDRAATPAATGERRSTGPGRRGTEPTREPRWPVVGSNRAGAGRTERASRGARGPGSTSGATGPRVAWGNDAGDRKSSTTGTVKWFKSGKGFGFIAQDKGGPDVFVHHSAIEGDGYRNLEEGQRVRFDTTEGPKGLQASLVRPA